MGGTGYQPVLGGNRPPELVVETDDSWIPEAFKQGMADAASGRFADMETVVSGAKPCNKAEYAIVHL